MEFAGVINAGADPPEQEIIMRYRLEQQTPGPAGYPIPRVEQRRRHLSASLPFRIRRRPICKTLAGNKISFRQC